MADAMAAGTALEKVPETEVLVGEIDSTMSDLMLAARQAENLKPLTEEEADGMTVAQLGDRAALIFSHYKCTLMSERDFILKFRVELNVLRRKTTQQGRRLPIPGCPTWGEVKKTYFKLSGRQIDALLADPKPDKTEPEPEPTEVREITVSDDQPETPTPSEGPEPEVLEPHQPLSVTDAEVARIHEAASADTLPDTGGEVAAEREDPRTEPAPCSLNEVTVSVLANILNRAFAEKKGRHEAVRDMLKLLDKCILWEISYASSEERSNRLQSADTSARHVFPSEAAQEVLKRGGFWSAKALIGEADIHVTTDSVPNGCGVSLDHFKQHVLGWLRDTGKLKTRMLGRVNWYCHPDHEAASRLRRSPRDPSSTTLRASFRRGGGSAAALYFVSVCLRSRRVPARLVSSRSSPETQPIPNVFCKWRVAAEPGRHTAGTRCPPTSGE
jgi:hypothetical protein